MVREDRVRDAIDRGELVPLLESYCLPFPGYYSQAAHGRDASPALRALAEYLKRARNGRRRTYE